ncbi:hypothetical protein OVY48_16345 [Sphingobium sp. SA2]|jgi:hypothetical protein|uniref:hypothetical protein n=1 Tax=unclassified Sphingobium TaxID=2611147 RepID=UPI0005009549|nr:MULTISPECIES: hypothetical protein [unclassified Sphingobium]AOF95827.1 hypothetical protein BSY17_2383 [Sphingobium sp. RAC03]KFL47688.1 hypothetical protein IL54_3115 [Sphingobium sp. ba1]MDT7534984.1 hypothetical protein [Sphingobium sp. SA2]OHD02757.1 MAG: hypothetical protein A3H25_07640 [Sphingomonadales bacterium RIFCSPLOWO2_12_FULL_63_15]|tara:strand:+ start:3004 stop:3630 length:627 start_codon:yes stop_codon:yes gene_type:complete
MNRFPLTACLPFLLLAACGRTEPVADMPSQEELAAAANAAAAEALATQQSDEGLESLDYVNAARGFSVTLPEGWVKDESASNADGVVYEDPGAGADVRVFWQKNDGDQTLQQIVEAVSDGAEGVDGDFIGDNEYRGTANDGEGNNVAVRLLRQPDGSIVTATFVYPEMLSEQYQSISDALLRSLRLLPAATPAAAPEAAANAASAPKP